MEQAVSNFDIWLKAFVEGFVAFPIVYYVVKNFGAVIWTDLKTIWTKYATKTTVVPTPVVAPVVNG